MVTLREVSASFWNYISPRKTQQRRDKPFKVPDIPHRSEALTKQNIVLLKEKGRSPAPRVHKWSPRTPSPLIDIDATLLPPSPPASALQSHDDLEGDTLISESPGNPSEKVDGSSEDEWNANEDTMVVDDGTYMEKRNRVDVDAERKKREVQARELRDAGWSEDAVFLFQKLGMRGFEPILPINWLDDFETLPEDLFTARADKVFIRPSQGSEYHGMYLGPICMIFH